MHLSCLKVAAFYLWLPKITKIQMKNKSNYDDLGFKLSIVIELKLIRQYLALKSGIFVATLQNQRLFGKNLKLEIRSL